MYYIIICVNCVVGTHQATISLSILNRKRPLSKVQPHTCFGEFYLTSYAHNNKLLWPMKTFGYLLKKNMMGQEWQIGRALGYALYSARTINKIHADRYEFVCVFMYNRNRKWPGLPSKSCMWVLMYGWWV